MGIHEGPWPAGTPCWIDMGSQDLDAALSDYSQIFGWQYDKGPAELGYYTNMLKDGATVAGLSAAMSPEQPEQWLVYLATDNIDDTYAKACEAGASVIAEPMQVMDFGKMAVLVDPFGCVFGLWESGTHTGFNRFGEPGAVCWSELVTPQPEESLAFYSKLFDYSTELGGSMGEEYVTVKAAGAEAFGVTRGTPDRSMALSAWLTYFLTDDADSTVELVESLGGERMSPTHDSPHGRWCVVAGPRGSIFALVGA